MGGDDDLPLHGAGGVPDLKAANPSGLQMIREMLSDWWPQALAVWVGIWVISSIRKNGVWGTIDLINQFFINLVCTPGNAENPNTAPVLPGGNNDGQNEPIDGPAVGNPVSTYFPRGSVVFQHNGHNFNFGEHATSDAVTGFMRAVRLSPDAASGRAEGAVELIESPAHTSPTDVALPSPAPLSIERPSPAQGPSTQAEATPAQASPAVGHSTQVEAIPANAHRPEITQAEAPAPDDGPA